MTSSAGGISSADTRSLGPPEAFTGSRRSVEAPSLGVSEGSDLPGARRLVGSPRVAVGEPRAPSGAARARQLRGARPRFRGFENFPARVPRRRAAAGRDPRGLRLPRGTFRLLGPRRSGFAMRLPLGSRGASSLPLGEDLARAAAARSLSPAPSRRPRLSRRLSQWPGPAPRADGRRARHRREGRRGPATRGPEAAWSRLFANGPERYVQVASHSGGGGGAGAPDASAGERGARGGARRGRTGSASAAPAPLFVRRRGADRLRAPRRLRRARSPRRSLPPGSPPPPPPSRPRPPALLSWPQ